MRKATPPGKFGDHRIRLYRITMLPLCLDKQIQNILVLGAHCDDIEIGCGGALLKIIQDYPNRNITWVVFSSNKRREAEAQRSAELFLANAKNKTIIVKEFRNGFFPYVGIEIKEYFEELKSMVNPDLIFTHYRNDLHQDHRLLSELTWNTYRDNFILEYEIPKYDGDLGNPNFFVSLPEETCKQKIKNVVDCFESQKDKQWFTESTFWGLMRLRGVQCNCVTGYAEAFYAKKLVL